MPRSVGGSQNDEKNQEVTPKGAAMLIESWRDQLTREPDRADIHFRLGQALERLEQFDDAIRHYRKALALFPMMHDHPRSSGSSRR